MNKKRIITCFVIALCFALCGCQAGYGLDNPKEATVEVENTERIEEGLADNGETELETEEAETEEAETAEVETVEPETAEVETEEAETVEETEAEPETTEAESETTEAETEPETTAPETEPETTEPEPVYTVTEVEPYTMYSTTSLNVRAKAYKAADRVYILSTNDEVTVTATCDNGWVYVSSSKGEGYCNSHYLASEPIVQVTQAEAAAPESVSSAVVRGNCTNKQYNSCVSIYQSLPSHVRERIEDCGWQVVFTTDDFWSQYGYTDVVVGVTDYQSQTIWVKASTSRLQVVIFHEIGHFVDWYWDFPSQTSEFTDLYNNERSGFNEYKSYDDHAQTAPIEYFATIWEQIYLAPDTESSAPESFAFVRQYCG